MKNKDNSNPRITIEDYKEEFLFKKNKSNLSIQFNRIAFIFFVFFIISLIYSIHLIHLGSRSFPSKNIKNINNNSFKRSDIVDRNGTILAKTVRSIDVGINPNEVIDKKRLIINLKYIFPKKDFKKIEKKINNNKFFWFEKKISDENYDKLMRLGDKSIKTEKNLIRIYPQKNLFSHLIGQIDNDNLGISGLEKSFDKVLKNSSKELKLTVDTEIQFLVRNELKKFNSIFKTKGSTSILMNIHSGEILSLVSLPDFDLNKREKITDKNFINRATKGVYEFGSVFKTFTIAAALNENIIETDSMFTNLEKKIKCGKFIINEYDEEMPTDLTVEEILIRSGNIGSVRIGQKLGIDKLKNFFKRIGILETLKFDIEEIGNPISFNWGKCKLATVSYGHGITTTPLQLAKGYAIVTNGGFKVEPTIIKKELVRKSERILKPNISKKINEILRKVVTSKEGTANFANIKGYEVGGKTGTAQKTMSGGYSKNKVNTFAAVFPASKPVFTLIVLLDEPKTNKDYIYEYRDGSGLKYKGTPFNTAGWTSVEVAGQIIEKIGPILATKY